MKQIVSIHINREFSTLGTFLASKQIKTSVYNLMYINITYYSRANRSQLISFGSVADCVSKEHSRQIAGIAAKE